MKTCKLGPFRVAEIGLGCMNLSHAYGVPPPVEVAEKVLLEAVARGVTLFDTAALYGFGENEELVGRVLAPHRESIVLATKFTTVRSASSTVAQRRFAGTARPA